MKKTFLIGGLMHKVLKEKVLMRILHELLLAAAFPFTISLPSTVFSCRFSSRSCHEQCIRKILVDKAFLESEEAMNLIYSRRFLATKAYLLGAMTLLDDWLKRDRFLFLGWSGLYQWLAVSFPRIQGL